MKIKFSGHWKTAREIPPRKLMELFLKGDQEERRETANEILRRLELFDILSEKQHSEAK